MKCIFCGKDNESSNKQCKYCGYIFDFPTDTTTDSYENSIPVSNTRTEKWENSIEETLHKIKYKRRTMPPPEAPLCSVQSSVSNHASTENNIERSEIIIASFLYFILFIIVMYGLISNGSISFLFKFEYSVVIGVIGLVSFIFCGSYESIYPTTIPGIIVRTTFLLLAWEIPNIVTFILYSSIICISVIWLIHLYGNKLSSLLLGFISIICLPFLGIVIAIIIGLLFRKSGSSKRKSSR